jgi:hypothetical protein
MRARVSKISLVVFVLMLILGGFLPSVPGDYWPWFAVAAVFAFVPAVVGPRWHRRIGIGGLALSAALIAGDYAGGKRFHERLRRRSIEQPGNQVTEGRTNRSSEPPSRLP